MKIIIDDELVEFSSDDLEKMYVGDGLESNVYRYNDEALKVYNTDNWKRRLNEGQSLALSSISTKRILLPKRMIYDGEYGRFNGYTTRFVEGHSLELILDASMTHFIDELSVLEDDIKLLSDNYVIVDDFELINILFNGSLYFCDPGSFEIAEYDFVSKQRIFSSNCTLLNRFIKNELFRLIDLSNKMGMTLTNVYKYYEENYRDFCFWKDNDWGYLKHGSVVDKLKEDVKSGETVRQYVKRTHA